MPLLLLLVFIGIPIAEIAVFIVVGDQIGLGWTLASIFATAIIGTALVRHQGLQTLARVRASMDRKELPVQDMISGVCILVAGILLVTPGFVTDTIGFLLLIPPFRLALGASVLTGLMRNGRFTMRSAGGMGSGSRPPPNGRGPVIDGEFEEIDENAKKNTDSPWTKGASNSIENRGNDQ
ncbi:MAG TPA: exclusion suppressor FxsA [Rhodospirillaceae bacterium]|nr:exclusion suppressor FxsA [Rhodospirillaceae bacterium]MAX63663.1 exclusion suppressor FxsA [Rhodospirillaceae bacterium]MBB56639.1 exclusion suppressor FxsA [Rhodospirillaceae bacterium]HAE01227.1 exclusion suppressor FxsA [Rhodospirillaceae bacterium]HAJ20978.1 exclusion suppressor FxsA [Rhodospirillaceae bacterium]|tara:strand:+ start:371 stop:910 length:540 start_codon:yes stop_codon:yes gene_type:complete